MEEFGEVSLTADKAVLTTETSPIKTTESLQPKETKITLKKGLKQIGKGSGGAVAAFFLDEEEKVGYRVIEWERLAQISDREQRERDQEYAGLDFNYKLKVARTDTTGLTPRIYEFDPEAGIFKMEYLEGTPLDRYSGELAQETIDKFLTKLDEYHRLGLYHGDTFPLSHYILTPAGEIRLIDPSFIRYIDDEESLRSQQEIDKALARSRLKTLMNSRKFQEGISS